MLLLLCWGSISTFAQTGGFDPVNPPEPMLQYKVTVNSTPNNVAYTSGGGKYNGGTTITIGTSSRNTNYEFDHWLKDGVRIDEGASFSYVVEAKNVVFTAVYRFNPTSPPEPTVSNKYRLYLVPSPQGICSFNMTSGLKQEAGSRFQLRANGSQGFVFSGWYDGEELVSNQSSFYYTMPARDVILTAKYTYNPDSPSEPETLRMGTNVYLPNAPFEFYYNAADYDDYDKLIPNHPDANLRGASLVLSENIPQWIDNELLRINNSCLGRINRWAENSTESGQHFYRSGENCLTMVCKVSPNFGNGSNASDFISNRQVNYNYMWRIGHQGKMYLHTNDSYNASRSINISENEPQILAVRVDGKNNYIQLDNLTTGESLRVNNVNWGGSNNVFRLFKSSSSSEFFKGDFYWVYYSFELLTDKQLRVFTDGYLLGDVNNDGEVDVNDIVTTANFILHQVNPEANAAPPVFIFKAADVIEDSDIDVNDIVGIANIIIENAQGN